MMLTKITKSFHKGTNRELGHKSHSSLRKQRGATLTEAALLIALIVVGSLSAIEVLQRESGTILERSGNAIGNPKPSAFKIPGKPNRLPMNWVTESPEDQFLDMHAVRISGEEGCLAHDDLDVISSGCNERNLVAIIGIENYVFISFNDNECITNDGESDVRLQACISQDKRQRWIVEELGDDQFKFVHQASGRCLDMSTESVSLQTCEKHKSNQSFGIKIKS